jgi:hypothetical protein
MKYLHKFFRHLNESLDITDLSKEELDEMLLPIKDLEIEYSFQEARTITEGEFEGYKSMNITFRNSFKTAPIGGYTEMITDDKFWEFLDELIAFKNRLESVQVSINTNWKWGIVVCFIQNAKVEGDLFKIQKLYNEMTKRTSVSKSDFTNNMTKRLDKENLKITVNCSGYDQTSSYTDRKWNGLFRGVDFSEFNIEKEITTLSHPAAFGNKSAVITITLKSSEEH